MRTRVNVAVALSVVIAACAHQEAAPPAAEATATPSPAPAAPPAVGLTKFTKDGVWVKALDERGNAPNQFNTPHGITSDNAGNIYVADRGNRRVQVFDPDLNPFRIIEGMGAP